MRHHLILRVITKLLVGPIVLFALYVQFHGDYSPGGGFQAGVIFAVAFILFGLVYSLETCQEVCPPWIAHRLMALGVLIFSGTGVVSFFKGGNFLDYDVLLSDPIQGQHYGILAVELGVLVTVFSVMVSIYYAFAGRPPCIEDDDW